MKGDPRIKIVQACPQDAATVCDILIEAARWLKQEGMPLWKEDELSPAHLSSDVAAGLFFLATYSGEAAATVKFQLEDPLFWPEDVNAEASYVHRLAVRRRFAGMGFSTVLLAWAAERTRGLGRRYLRLDCDAARPRLRAIYESFGFRFRSDKQVGPYFVSRYEYDVTLAR